MAILFSGSSHAVLLFDNGTSIDPTNGTWNDTYSAYTIYDDFLLTENSTITDINYSIFTQNSSNYTQSFVTILDSIGGSTIIASFAVTGSLSPNGLVTINPFTPNGFDVVLSGLNIDLLAGTYALGLSTDMAGSSLASIGSGDSGYGSSLVQNSDPFADHMVFSIEGTVNTVPEPSILVLMGIGLLGIGFARNTRNKCNLKTYAQAM